MRILIVHSIYRPYKKGGAEVVVEGFVNELKKKHEVIVLTAEKQGTRNNKQGIKNTTIVVKVILQRIKRFRVSIEDGVTVIRLIPCNIFSVHDIDQKPFWMRLIWHAFDVWNVHSLFVVKWVLRKYQPDVVWTHTMKGIGYLPFKAINQWKDTNSDNLCYSKSYPTTQKRWIFTPHNEELIYQFGYGLHPFRIGTIERFTMFFTRWFTKGVDLVLAPSRQIIELHAKLGFWKNAEKLSLWPCFVEKKHNSPQSSPTLRERELEDSPLKVRGDERGLMRPFTFGFIGQIEEHKGIRQLIQAFETYQGSEAKLFIAGRGRLASWVNEKSRNNSRIEFYGEYRQDELQKLFSNISVLVVPSLIRDNMPTVILEAFAHELPVIGSNLGGIPEVLGYRNHAPRGPKVDSNNHCYSNKSWIGGGNEKIHYEESTQEKDKKLKDVGGLLLSGFEEKDFRETFDEIQKPEVYQRLVENIKNWKPVTIQEVLERIGL